MGSALLFLFYTATRLIIFVVIINVVLSWLVVFGVLNIRNPTIYRIITTLESLTEPLMRPIRRIMPNLGGIDLSPLVLIILVQFLQVLVHRTIDLPLRQLLG